MENLVFLVLLLTILNTVFHVTHIYSDKGFKNSYLFFFSLIMLLLYTTSFLTIFSSILFKKFSNSYFFLFSLYHYIAFFFIYFLIICSTIILKYITLGIKSFILLFSNFEFNLIPKEYKIMYIPIYKNTTFLKKVFMISYLLSVLTFIFISKNYLISVATNDPSIDLGLFNKDIELYYSAFFISAITLLVNFKNFKN